MLTEKHIQENGLGGIRSLLAKKPEQQMSYAYDQILCKAQGKPLKTDEASKKYVAKAPPKSPLPKDTKALKRLAERALEQNPDLTRYMNDNARRLLSRSAFYRAKHECATSAAHARSELQTHEAHLRALTKQEAFVRTRAARDPQWKPKLIELEGEIRLTREKIAGAKDEVVRYQDGAEFNRVIGHAARNSSYRWMTWVLTKQRLGYAGTALNVSGMLIMILTAPLMYEGMKQWGQEKFGHSQQGQDQQQS